MTNGIKVEIVGAKELANAIGRVPEVMYKDIKPIFNKSALNVQSTMLDRTTHGPLFGRTGNLARSFNINVGGSNLSSLYSTVYNTASYAPIHEEGGVVRAKNAYAGLGGGPFLNIPADDNKTAKGVMRFSATEVFNQGGYIRKIKNPKKAKYMVLLNNKPMFWLVKEVTIKPRMEMEKTAINEVPTLLSRISDKLDEVLDDD